MNKYNTYLQEQRKHEQELCTVLSNYLNEYMAFVNSSIEVRNLDNILGDYDVLRFSHFDCITAAELSDDGETLIVHTMYHDFDGHDHDYNTIHTSYKRFDLWLEDKEKWKADVLPYIDAKIDDAIAYERVKAEQERNRAAKRLAELKQNEHNIQGDQAGNTGK